MSKKFIQILAPVLAVSLIAGVAAPIAALAKKPKTECQVDKDKKATEGMVIGGVAGAVGGNVVAGKKNKGLGTIAGAVVGGVVGSKLAKDKVKCGDQNASASASVSAGVNTSGH